MDIDEYLAFQKLVTNPPGELLIGVVRNLPSKRWLEDGEYHNHSDTKSVALEHFFDGYRQEFPRIYHTEHIFPLDYQPRFHITSRRGRFSMSSDIKTLMSVANPAPFGDLQTGTTRYDSEVRNCYQIEECPTVSCFDLDLPDRVIDAIQNSIFPNQKILLRFNKINIYHPGGHFKRHVDTPKPGVIGTVVIFSSNHEFTGGDLVVDDNGRERRFRSGMVAFYSNTPHWVEPVTSGYRVTATYYILQENAHEPEPEPYVGVPPATTLEVLQRETFGIVLSETYSRSESDVLKGKDRKLTDLLPYFNVRYLPVITQYKETYDYEDDDEENFTALVFRCTEDDFNRYKSGSKPTDPPAGGTFLDCYIIPKSTNIGGYEVYTFSQGYIEHVGNECQEGIINNTYFSRLAIFTPCSNPS